MATGLLIGMRSLDMLSIWASHQEQNQLTNYVSFFCPCLLANVRKIQKFGVALPFTTTPCVYEIILIISRMFPLLCSLLGQNQL